MQVSTDVGEFGFLNIFVPIMQINQESVSSLLHRANKETPCISLWPLRGVSHPPLPLSLLRGKEKTALAFRWILRLLDIPTYLPTLATHVSELL